MKNLRRWTSIACTQSSGIMEWCLNVFALEAKKRWFLHALVFTLFVVWLFVSLFMQKPNALYPAPGIREQSSQSQHFSMSKTLGKWQLNQVPAYERKASLKPHIVGISPNLSTCQRSIAQGDYKVYCCPPKPESEEPFSDFQFPDPSAPKRIRRPIHHADEDYIAKYRKAFAIMKSLPYDNPLSFRRQADLHCIYCTGAYYQNGASVSIDIHNSWLFFPWHRMMLYFHERILAKFIDDDTFALPFWNWDSPEGMMIPDIYYHEPFLDTERSASRVRPGKIVDLSYSTNVENNLQPKEQIAKNLNLMYSQMVSGAKKVELFMGCAYKPGAGNSCARPGTIESAPHNALHAYIGKESNRFLENMGAFYSAARDPIFFAHHPNMDRLWEVWKGFRDYEPEIIDPDWLESYFFFHNENSQLVRIKIRDVLNITKLGYSYEKVALPWLHARPKPSVDPVIARHSLNARNNGHMAAMASDFRPSGRALDANITAKVFRPKRPKRIEKEKEEVLVVYGIEVKEDMVVKFDVYVNAIYDDTIGPESREFAGTFINVPRGMKLKRDGKCSLQVGISELLEDLQAGEDEFIWVSLVSTGGTGVLITVDGIRIEYMT